jgi:hypothetical protein
MSGDRQAAGGVSFARVRIGPEPPPATPEAAGGGVEIVLADSRVVRVGAGFDAPTLRRVLAVLEGGQC